MIFAYITVGIFRRWQARKKIVALMVKSHGEHTETAMLLDDSGSAYQITLHASGFHFRPTLTITEFLPGSLRELHQRCHFSNVFVLRRDLDRALELIHGWIAENKATRLPQAEELKMVGEMFEKRRRPNQPPLPTPGKCPPSNHRQVPGAADL